MWHARFDITCVPLVTDVNHVTCLQIKVRDGHINQINKKHRAFVRGEKRYINGKDACTCCKEHFGTEKMETKFGKCRDCCNH